MAQFVGQSNLIRGKWEGDQFICGSGQTVNGAGIPDSFHEDQLYPVKADAVRLVAKDQSRFTGKAISVMITAGVSTAPKARSLRKNGLVPITATVLQINTSLIRTG